LEKAAGHSEARGASDCFVDRFFTDLTAHDGALDPRIGVIWCYQVISETVDPVKGHCRDYRLLTAFTGHRAALDPRIGVIGCHQVVFAVERVGNASLFGGPLGATPDDRTALWWTGAFVLGVHVG